MKHLLLKTSALAIALCFATPEGFADNTAPVVTKKNFLPGAKLPAGAQHSPSTEKVKQQVHGKILGGDPKTWTPPHIMEKEKAKKAEEKEGDGVLPPQHMKKEDIKQEVTKEKPAEEEPQKEESRGIGGFFKGVGKTFGIK